MRDIVLQSEAMKNALSLSELSRKEAKEYPTLYHCTNAEAFINIIKNREFWLSNLKRVNDSIEYEMIDYEKLHTAYYVACFSSKNDISIDHWRKYGNMDNGILFSINQLDFTKSAVFLTEHNQRMDDFFWEIISDRESALKYKIQEQQNQHITYPFYIEDYGFYKVLYDDDLSPKIKGKGRIVTNSATILGTTIVPSVAGIVKKTKGIDNKTGLAADWKDESEIRLKLCIVQMKPDNDGIYKNDSFCPKVAVSLTDNAFSDFEIRFSPNFSDERKRCFLEELKKINPDSTIKVL